MPKSKAQIEAWALAVIDDSRAGRRVEDDRVELKESFVEPAKAARRIAGLANAARTEPFLVLIGIKECVGPVALPKDPEFSRWWTQVASFLDPSPPRLEHLIVEGVHVLYFEPDRPPYVVKHRQDPTDSSGLWEVPWREGTATRSARHTDLIRLLVPRARVPELQVLRAKAATGLTDKHEPSLSVDVTLYVVPQTPERLVLPLHQCSMEARWGEPRGFVDLRGGLMPLGERKSKTIHYGADEVVVDGPGRIRMSGFTVVPVEEIAAAKAIDLRMHLDPLPESDHVTVETSIESTGTNAEGRHFWGADPPKERPKSVTTYRSGWMDQVTGGRPWSATKWR
ncbi:MAG: hypothetical protein IT347_08840 [Candidatus Eisenbacteria bacterium]|nr:hypothetical protein [Candidatus Eisenbacteria bacterium]